MPLGLVYEITSRCNLDCGFCYNTLPHGRGKVAPLEWVTMKSLLHSAITQSGAAWLAFAGGEPLLHPHIREAIRYCRQAFPRLSIGMATNATLLDEELCAGLKQDGLDYIEIPLLASDEELYERMTGVHQLSQVRETLSYVKQNGFRLNVSVMLSSQNAAELPVIMELAFAFGADTITINRFIPTGMGRNNKDRYIMKQKDLSQALKVADKTAGVLSIPVAVSIPVRDCDIPHSGYPHLQFSPCVCGRDKWVIDPVGGLRTCEQNEEVLGSLLEQSFQDIVMSDKVQTFRENNRYDYCEEKDCFARCGGGCRFE